MSSYRELPGDGVVQCWWERRVGPGNTVYRVVPDACSDIIVSATGEALLVGPTLRAALRPMVPGTHLRAVRFRTEALAAALGLPAPEVTDLFVPLSSALPSRTARRLTEQVWEGRFTEVLRTLCPSPVEARVRHTVRRLWSSGTTLAALAVEIGIGERQLRRLVLANTGLAPKAVQRVGRFKRFLRAAEAGHGPGSLAGHAAAAGYADQAHLAREVRELTGLAPGALLAERSVRAVESARLCPDGVGERGRGPA
ncbi:helix-turn-helix domain-containing protein [Amycolatopsis rhizosphaerae]|uniref:Helix-turn-helix domain-containing protein n=1 Tax=Amycolatopsis rhizosphaerae TaxID=2053003 RepID=A0A558BWW1_9PSEU|nr:helix-turn-helix domain-containing protein [Amycolatopsis rhizosphaerae]TVT40953.1 helix-turn-helix domain-containing protein [Amycolatopsis rhizosphaerae]